MDQISFFALFASFMFWNKMVQDLQYYNTQNTQNSDQDISISSGLLDYLGNQIKKGHTCHSPKGEGRNKALDMGFPGSQLGTNHA